MRAPLLAGFSTLVIFGQALANPGLAAGTVAHNCQCLARGHAYAQGEIACIDGKRLQCAMSQNVSSWNPLDGQCRPEDLNASLVPLLLPHRLSRPLPGQTLPLTPM